MSLHELFRDREDAGRQLAEALAAHRGENAVVLGLPRGGVPVAFEVARALRLPLDVLIVRKLGAPNQPELGMGAVAEGDVVYLDPAMVEAVGATRDQVAHITARERREVERRVQRWRGDRPPVSVEGKTAIVVDDGIATGGTIRAALRALRLKHPKRVVLAVPVAPVDTLQALRADADEIVCVAAVESLYAIGSWYDDFTQVPDARVTELLERERVEAIAGEAPAR